MTMVHSHISHSMEYTAPDRIRGPLGGDQSVNNLKAFIQIPLIDALKWLREVLLVILGIFYIEFNALEVSLLPKPS